MTKLDFRGQQGHVHYLDAWIDGAKRQPPSAERYGIDLPERCGFGLRPIIRSDLLQGTRRHLPKESLNMHSRINRRLHSSDLKVSTSHQRLPHSWNHDTTVKTSEVFLWATQGKRTKTDNSLPHTVQGRLDVDNWGEMWHGESMS